MMEPSEILCGIVVVILALYYYFTSTFDFWKSRGVRGPRPIPVFGNIKNLMLTKIALSDFMTKIYSDFKDEPIIGIFARKTPILIIKNPDLIKDVLIKDFSIFADRGFATHERSGPLSQHLFNLEPKRWRPLRTRLSPIFTSGKLKEMLSMISNCAEHLEQYIEKVTSRNEPVECHELTAKYTTDVIGTCVFGIEMNALSDEESEFRRMGRKVFTPSRINLFRVGLKRIMPWLFNIIYFILPHSTTNKFFSRVITETMDYREMHNIVRNDFIDMLRELKKNPDKLGDINMTDSLLISQAFVFFLAGFETSSTTMSHALYELAINQKIQDKLREEIDQEYAKYGSDLTYKNLKKMDYLDKVFKETLRKYPPATNLLRQSTSSYTFNGTKVNIPKGQKIWIPVHAIQRDPSIYPEPNVFDPERFSEEVVQIRHPMYYLPFGDGPRNCIGARFGIFQTKIGLVKILRNYKVKVCEKTQIPYITDPRALVLASKGGIYLRIVKINPA